MQVYSWFLYITGVCPFLVAVIRYISKKKGGGLHKEVGSVKSGLKRSRARSTVSHGSEELLTSETFFAVTAPTMSCRTASLEGCIDCSADVSVNWPQGRPGRAGANTSKLTYTQSTVNGSTLVFVLVWAHLPVRVAVTDKGRVVRGV